MLRLWSRSDGRESRFLLGEYKFALAAVPENTPKTRGGVSLCLQLSVNNLEEALKSALTAGAIILAPRTAAAPIFTSPRGERVANVEDINGQIWSLTEA